MYQVSPSSAMPISPECIEHPRPVNIFQKIVGSVLLVGCQCPPRHEKIGWAGSALKASTPTFLSLLTLSDMFHLKCVRGFFSMVDYQ